MAIIAGIKFEEWGKTYSFDAKNIELHVMDPVIVETERGLCFGRVKVESHEVPDADVRGELKTVIRKATEEDLMQLERNREKEKEALRYCREKIDETGLQMKLVGVEYLFDGSKAIFKFTSEGRIDFRELVRDLAAKFHTRIEMRQIGVRDEAKIKGGFGPCGRLLCCSTWIKEFEPVSVKMAKSQGLSLNPANISGMCGRLMCCLAFEYQNYIDGVIPRPSAIMNSSDGNRDRPNETPENEIREEAEDKGEKTASEFKKADIGKDSPDSGKKNRRRRFRRNKRKKESAG